MLQIKPQEINNILLAKEYYLLYETATNAEAI
jgi:hypothetical protein